MSFMTNSGRKVSLFVTDPREDVTETEIKEVMDLIIEKNIFAPNGEDIVSAKDAKNSSNWNNRVWFNSSVTHETLEMPF